VVSQEDLVAVEGLRHAVEPASRDARTEGGRVEKDVDEDVLRQILGVVQSCR
jgi:hypothetical protein